MDYTIAVKQILMTPESSDYILENFNVRNRTRNEQAIRQYTEQIINGGFYFTHQGIARDRNGYLMDGQHRLTAIKKSGKPIPMFEFSYSIDLIQPSGELHPVMMVFDKGRARTIAQNLGLNGMKNANLIAAICNAVRAFLFGSTKVRSDEFMINAIYSIYFNSIDEIISTWGQKNRHAIVMASLVLMHAVSPEKTISLTRAVATNVGLRDSSAELAIHKFIDGPLKDMTGASQRVDAMNRIVNGCLKYLDDEPIKALCESQSARDRMVLLHQPQKSLISQQPTAV